VKPMVILLVDDEVGVQEFVAKLLQSDGLTVLTAGDGKAAMEASRNYPGSIDLLLSDVEMPRMGGPDLCRNITAERPGIKVLLMSGDLRCIEQISASGLPFLHKPFTRATLRNSIEALIGPLPPLVGAR
jgi:DNA-binding NtrC family response regulator